MPFSSLDMPEVLWKAYIDFEIEQEEYDRVRILYESLLQRTTHLKVWVSWAEFELNKAGDVGRARALYKRANASLAESGAQANERLLLLETWKKFESGYGDDSSVSAIEQLLPRRVKKRRQITADDGTDAGWEEYFEYIFPEDQASQINFKLLDAARRWRESRQRQQQEGS